MAFPKFENLKYYRGDTFEFDVVLKQQDGSDFDLTIYENVTFKIATKRGPTGTQTTGVAVKLGVATVTAASRTSGNTQITITAANHGYSVGDQIKLSGIDDAVNGEYTVSLVSNANTFKVVGTSTDALSLTGLTGYVALVGDSIIRCTIPSTTGRGLATGDYFYDVQITDTTPDPDVIYTVLTGVLVVTDDVSGAV